MEIKKGQVWECKFSIGNWTKGENYLCEKDSFIYNSNNEQERISDDTFLKNYFKLIGTTDVEETNFKTITDSISSLLEYKNANYGNAALEPLNVFSDKTPLGHRLDDKLSRIKNSEELRKNDIADLIGYLILECKRRGWNNFDEFKD